MSETLVEVVLQRYSESAIGTRGGLFVDSSRICYTLEQPWRENQHDISCIPPGSYVCIPHDSEKFQDVWEVTGVPDRGAILIHCGNTVADTHGCILVGLSETPLGVASSRAALMLLHQKLPETFTLKVENPR